MSYGTLTSTPPSVFVIFEIPTNDVTAQYSIGMPVSSRTVRTSRSGPPYASAALILLRPCPGMFT